MSPNRDSPTYRPEQPTDPEAWLAHGRTQRTRAVRTWLQAREVPSPCGEHSAEHWREVEDELAAGYPPETGRLIERMRHGGLSRTVAIWALCTLREGQRYRQHCRVLRRDDAISRADRFSMQALLDERDFAILPAAFQAGGGDHFGPSHVAVIAHHHRYYAAGSAMDVAEAAGFCFGVAASPRRLSPTAREAHLLGTSDLTHAPPYLPVGQAFDRLDRWVSDALFDGRDPIPDFCRPRMGAVAPKSCIDWSRGVERALAVTAADWRRHLEDWSGLRERLEASTATLTWFAGAGSEHTSRVHSCQPSHAEMASAARRLFRLAHPVRLADGTTESHRH